METQALSVQHRLSNLQVGKDSRPASQYIGLLASDTLDFISQNIFNQPYFMLVRFRYSVFLHASLHLIYVNICQYMYIIIVIIIIIIIIVIIIIIIIIIVIIIVIIMEFAVAFPQSGSSFTVSRSNYNLEVLFLLFLFFVKFKCRM